MKARISEQIERIVGPAGVDVIDVHNDDPANPRVRVETAHVSYVLPANRLMALLKQLPDDIGVLPFRKAIEDEFPSVIGK